MAGSTMFAANPESQANLEDIQRRMALAEKLRQMGLAGGGGTQSVGGVAIKQSPFETLGRLAQLNTANTMDTQSTADRKALAAQLQLYQKKQLDALFGGGDEEGTAPPPPVAAAQPTYQPAVDDNGNPMPPNPTMAPPQGMTPQGVPPATQAMQPQGAAQPQAMPSPGGPQAQGMPPPAAAVNGLSPDIMSRLAQTPGIESKMPNLAIPEEKRQQLIAGQLDAQRNFHDKAPTPEQLREIREHPERFVKPANDMEGTLPPGLGGAPLVPTPEPAPRARAAQAADPGLQQVRAKAQALIGLGRPDDAMKLVLNYMEQTDQMKNMRAMGQDPRLMGQLGIAEARKRGIIELQPGTTAKDLMTGEERFQPKLGEGQVIGPGGRVSNAPGYVESAAGAAGAQAGATEGAKAGYDMVTVNTPSGPRMMTRADAARMAGGGGAGAGGGQGAQAPAAPPGVNSHSWGLAQAGIPHTVKIAPDGTQTIEIQGGPRADLMPSGRTAGAPQSGGRGIQLQSEGAGKTETTIGEGLGKQYVSIQDAGLTAGKKLNTVSQAAGLLENLNTGKLSPTGNEIAAWAKSFGFNVGANVGNTQAAKAVLNGMALELRNPSGGAGMPGAMSDADREYLKSMVAGIDKDPAANQKILDGMSKLAQRDQEIATLARQYKAQKGGFDDGFYDQLAAYSKANPLFPSAKATGGFKILGVR